MTKTQNAVSEKFRLSFGYLGGVCDLTVPADLRAECKCFAAKPDRSPPTNERINTQTHNRFESRIGSHGDPGGSSVTFVPSDDDSAWGASAEAQSSFHSQTNQGKDHSHVRHRFRQPITKPIEWGTAVAKEPRRQRFFFVRDSDHRQSANHGAEVHQDQRSR